MNVAHWHLIVVHLPVVGLLWTVALLIVAEAARSDLVRKIAYVSLVVCGLTGATAYFTGIGAANVLSERYTDLPDQLIEDHGLWGRGAFVATMILGVGGLSALLQYAQGDAPPRWLRLALLVASLLGVGLLGYTSHQGGMIRHPEARPAHLQPPADRPLEFAPVPPPTATDPAPR